MRSFTMSADPLNLVVEALQMWEEALSTWLAQVDELRRQRSASDPWKCRGGAGEELQRASSPGRSKAP